MFGLGKRWKIATIGRVPIYVGPAWLVVVLFVAASEYSVFKGIEPASAGWLAGMFALAFFGAVFVHELAHAWMSRRLGIPVRGITMMFFGGATETRADARGPGAEFLVSAAGPASTLVLSGVFWLAARPLHGAVQDLVRQLAGLNLLFAIFNVLPAAPLDGGRMLTAAVWGITGKRRTAQRVAGYVGTVVGIGVGILGYQQFVNNGGYGPFLLLVAFILITTGRGTEMRVAAQEQLAKGTATDAMREPPTSVPASMSLQDALDHYLRAAPKDAFPVVDQGRVIGTVSLTSARKVGSRDPLRPVRDGIAHLDLTPTFRPDEPLDLVAEWLSGLDGLVLSDGALIGAIGPADVSRWYQRVTQGGIAAVGIPPRPDL